MSLKKYRQYLSVQSSMGAMLSFRSSISTDDAIDVICQGATQALRRPQLEFLMSAIAVGLISRFFAATQVRHP